MSRRIPDPPPKIPTTLYEKRPSVRNGATVRYLRPGISGEDLTNHRKKRGIALGHAPREAERKQFEKEARLRRKLIQAGKKGAAGKWKKFREENECAGS